MLIKRTFLFLFVMNLSTFASAQNAEQAILKMAESNTACLSSKVKNRGTIKSAKGAFFGMALTFARSACRNNTDSAKQMMLKGRDKTSKKGVPFDAFRAVGKTPASDKDKLIQLYQILLPQTFMETSGKFQEGVDITNKRSTKNAISAEAGLCQTSYDIHGGGKTQWQSALLDVVESYQRAGNKKSCFTSAFSKGIKVKSDIKVVNGGKGGTKAISFQKLMRSCPAAAIEHCAIALRHSLPHYGPMIKVAKRKKDAHEPTIPACKKTFEDVYQYVESNKASVCQELSLESGGRSSSPRSSSRRSSVGQ